jgi:hypothetical protein
MITREIMQAWLDVLDSVQEGVSKGYRKVDPVITALRAELAKPEPDPSCCTTCANRGRVDGFSQEMYCSHCLWSNDSLRDNYRKEEVL